MKRNNILCKVLSISPKFVRWNCFTAMNFEQCPEAMRSERSLRAVQTFLMEMHIFRVYYSMVPIENFAYVCCT